MTAAWAGFLHGEHWRSPATLWVEAGVEHEWRQVDRLAAAIEAVIRRHPAARVVQVRSGSKLGCFAGQLAAWRAGRVAVADLGDLEPDALARVGPDLVLDVAVGASSTVEPVRGPAERRPGGRVPPEVVAVNFTSGTTGTRKAVAVTSGNLLALFACRGLDVAVAGGPTAGSFATPAFDGWWFDTWKTVAAGGRVVCLPNVNEDIFAWPDLVAEHCVDRVLLPAAVVATLVEAVPDCIADIPWVFSGGEQFQLSTYRRARAAGLTNRFVNLYGPTEATFATHRYDLPERPPATAVPIGRPLDGCRQLLRAPDGVGSGSSELVVTGPLVCAGYLDAGALRHRFGPDGRASYRTGDLVRVDDGGDIVFAGRLDSQLKVNGRRVDAAALERRVSGLPDVSDCRVVQNGRDTVAFVRADAGPATDPLSRGRLEAVVREFSPAITVRIVPRFPTKAGGKVDTVSLMHSHRATDKGGAT